jgi:beta-1,4-mannosyl-glycoprotein beta-1,4-N-acetylglucosaminyltransferase
VNRTLVVDAFPFHDELDILECRLVELYDAVDWFVLVEADVTHQDRAKPSYYMENRERFAAWADKIIPVWATRVHR